MYQGCKILAWKPISGGGGPKNRTDILQSTPSGCEFLNSWSIYILPSVFIQSQIKNNVLKPEQNLRVVIMIW